jgi:hypothetical protein
VETGALGDLGRAAGRLKGLAHVMHETVFRPPSEPKAVPAVQGADKMERQDRRL